MSEPSGFPSSEGFPECSERFAALNTTGRGAAGRMTMMMTAHRQIGFLISYSTPRGTCIDIQFGRDLFSAVAAFRLNGRRSASDIQTIREIGGAA